MLFPVKLLNNDFQVKPIGVLHVGAHEAEEMEEYEKFDWGHVVWVEAQPLLVEKLRNRIQPGRHTVIEAAAWSRTGKKLKFNIASNSQSSSLFEFGTHSASYPGIKFVETIEVETKRLDEILDQGSKFDFINLDIQGAELEALAGLGNLLLNAKWVYTELNRDEVYKGCAKLADIDLFLSSQGFQRVATRWVFGKGWGDGLYTKDFIRIRPSKLIWRQLEWAVIETPKYCLRVFRNLVASTFS